MIATTIGKVTSAVSSFPDVPSLTAVQTGNPKKMTRVILRENEYSLYSHVPRVLSHPLAIMRHFTPRKFPFSALARIHHCTANAAFFNPKTCSGIRGAQAMFHAKSRFGGGVHLQILLSFQQQGGKPIGPLQNPFPYVQRTGAEAIYAEPSCTAADNADKPVRQYKKEKKMSRGQKLALAAKRSKAPKHT
ncbi:hypothetical protein HDU77_007372 [Chytriomyces hyalinus]|nr:hypothetical protein HDU77_007372 [Chytriomyces hyalinus]